MLYAIFMLFPPLSYFIIVLYSTILKAIMLNQICFPEKI
jgi:hypothetical protein